MHINRRATAFTLVALFVAGIAASTCLRLYIMRDDGGGQILWNENEAYLFLSMAHRGFKMNYAEYAWVSFKQYFGGMPFPNDQHVFITVIRITPSGIERHLVDTLSADPGAGPQRFTPLKGTIYANCDGILCKWTGEGFASATVVEQRDLGGIANLSATDFRNVNGWSKVSVGKASVGHEVSIEMNNHSTLVVRNRSTDRDAYPSASIDLLRKGQPDEQVWHIDGHPHRVSRAKYDETFRK
jgi:hypothetical protein